MKPTSIESTIGSCMGYSCSLMWHNIHTQLRQQEKSICDKEFVSGHQSSVGTVIAALRFAAQEKTPATKLEILQLTNASN